MIETITIAGIIAIAGITSAVVSTTIVVGAIAWIKNKIKNMDPMEMMG